MCVDFVVNKAPKVIYVEEMRKPSICLTVVIVFISFQFLFYTL